MDHNPLGGRGQPANSDFKPAGFPASDPLHPSMSFIYLPATALGGWTVTEFWGVKKWTKKAPEKVRKGGWGNILGQKLIVLIDFCIIGIFWRFGFLEFRFLEPDSTLVGPSPSLGTPHAHQC